MRMTLSEASPLSQTRVFDVTRLHTTLSVAFCDSIDDYFAGPFKL